MPQKAIEHLMNELPKAGVLVGGMSTPAIINSPAVIDYKYLTTHTMLNITWDVWILILSALLTLHVLGLFRAIRWIYRKIKAKLANV